MLQITFLALGLSGLLFAVAYFFKKYQRGILWAAALILFIGTSLMLGLGLIKVVENREANHLAVFSVILSFACSGIFACGAEKIHEASLKKASLSLSETQGKEPHEEATPEQELSKMEEIPNDNKDVGAPGMEGVTLQQHYDHLKALVKEKTGRAMQEKDVEYKDKNGKTRVRKGSSPIREGVINIKPDTKMDDLLRYVNRVHERWGIRAIQIHMHRDEGHYENPEDKSTWQPNLHAHIIWDWIDHTTGKSFKLNAEDMSQIQDMVAETLEMEIIKRKTGLSV